MPEYLAPAVYVEETSFRSKPLEGVSTSTTAFVGSTRRGPVSSGDPATVPAAQRGLMNPELVTSVGDFERLYGGTGPLGTGTNYLAHAVRGFFANGGRRLYVARVFEPLGPADDGRASSRWVVGGPATNPRVRFEARFPGASGNGGVSVTQSTAPAAVRSMNRALSGTMLRTGADSPAGPAQLRGGVAPFQIDDQDTLAVDVGGVVTSATFEGTRAEALAPTPLADPVPLDGNNNTLTILINGLEHTVTLPAVATPRADVLAALNTNIQGGGYARLDGAGNLVIGSEIEGTNSTVTVHPSTVLGFTNPAAVVATPGVGNVGDLNAVTVNEISALFAAAAVDLSVDPATQELLITSQATSSAASLQVQAAPTSAHPTLNLATTVVNGTDGTTIEYYVKDGSVWRDSVGATLSLAPFPTGGVEFITLNISIVDGDGFIQQFEDLTLSQAHPSYIGAILAPLPPQRRQQLENVAALAVTGSLTPFELRQGLLGAGVPGGSASGARVSVEFPLSDGNDGGIPNPERFRQGLLQFDTLEDISIVAAPGSSAQPGAQAIRDHLITHVEQRRAYRIAVLDTPPQQTVGEARAVRSTMDSDHAALYYPWIIVPNPDARPGDRSLASELGVPPSGHVCGIYARNDNERGVHKAPANEVVRGTLRFESNINMRQQEVLNPEGVNALRSFPGRGHRVWGARLASSDPEFKYVNVRRYFNYISRTLDRGTQWVVFEPNGELLWDRVRGTVSDFLYDEWLNGALLGRTQTEAFFVRCDRSTMTQNDIDGGRLVCEVGMAVVKPAEFVIFRIGQKTATTSA